MRYPLLISAEFSFLNSELIMSAKGDERRPECKRCEKAGRSCFFSQERRHSSFDGNSLEKSDYFVFPEDHIWVDIPPSGEYSSNGISATY